MRRQNLTAEETGLLKQKVANPAAANPMANPNGMMDMMKGNVTMMVTNFGMMAWINNFFSGFILGKSSTSRIRVFKRHIMFSIKEKQKEKIDICINTAIF